MNMSPMHPNELAADRFARRITAQLSDGASELPYDISERLRASRMQALSRRKKTVSQVRIAPALVTAGHSAVLGQGDGSPRWWQSALSALPIMALLAGLVLINLDMDEAGTLEVAEVDAALLADDLPPTAYSDPGFVQFLKLGGTQPH
jgi:hypothetical protein